VVAETATGDRTAEETVREALLELGEPAAAALAPMTATPPHPARPAPA